MVFDNDANRVIVAEVVYVPLGIIGVRSVAQSGQEEDRVVVVGAERGFVHPPEQVTGGVCMDGDCNRCGRCGFRGGGEGEIGDGLVERVVAAVGIVIGGGGRCRDRVSVGPIVIDCGQGKRLLADTAGFADG